MEIYLYLFIIWTLLILTPGADFVLVLRNSINAGKLAGTFTAIGITIAATIQTSVVIFSLYIISTNARTFIIIQTLGAAYLLYLGIKGLKKSQVKLTKDINLQNFGIKNISKYLKEGFICNILNPKVLFSIMGVFSQINLFATSTSQKIYFILQVFLINLVVWISFAHLINGEMVKNKLNKYNKIINYIANIFLITIGVYIIINNLILKSF